MQQNLAPNRPSMSAPFRSVLPLPLRFVLGGLMVWLNRFDNEFIFHSVFHCSPAVQTDTQLPKLFLGSLGCLNRFLYLARIFLIRKKTVLRRTENLRKWKKFLEQSNKPQNWLIKSKKFQVQQKTLEKSTNELVLLI